MYVASLFVRVRMRMFATSSSIVFTFPNVDFSISSSSSFLLLTVFTSHDDDDGDDEFGDGGKAESTMLRIERRIAFLSGGDSKYCKLITKSSSSLLLLRVEEDDDVEAMILEMEV